MSFEPLNDKIMNYEPKVFEPIGEKNYELILVSFEYVASVNFFGYIVEYAIVAVGYN